MARVGHVAVQGPHAALLHPTGAGEQRQQAGLARAVRANEAYHAPSRDIETHGIKRQGLAVAQTDFMQPGHGRQYGWRKVGCGVAFTHDYGFTCRWGGHGAVELRRM